MIAICYVQGLLRCCQWNQMKKKKNIRENQREIRQSIECLLITYVQPAFLKHNKIATPANNPNSNDTNLNQIH